MAEHTPTHPSHNHEPETAQLFVVTASGTTYALDVQAQTVRRVRGEEAAGLRRDGESIPLLGLPAPAVGQPMILLLQLRSGSMPTVRVTTPVRKILRLPAEPHDVPAATEP